MKRRAFTIVELLMALPILVAAFAMSAQLLRTVVLTDSATAASSNHFSQVDAAVFQLRRDVWASEAIAIVNPTEADLILPGGKTIVWKIDGDEAVSRLDSAPRPLRWPSAGRGWTFARNATCLIVNAATSGDVQRMQMVSQVLLGGGSR